jgi:hypothetical protein
MVSYLGVILKNGRQVPGTLTRLADSHSETPGAYLLQGKRAEENWETKFFWLFYSVGVDHFCYSRLAGELERFILY